MQKNGGWPYSGWGIFEDDLFTEQAHAIQPHAQRLDEMLEGAKLAIAKDPRAHPSYPIPGTRLWQINVAPPPLRIWYTIEDDNCTLRGIALLEK